jgi:hypothetical protein
MGFKKTLPLYYPFRNQSVSGTNTVTSQSTFIGNLDNVGVQVIYTGSPTGNLSVNISNDGVNFNALSFSPSISQPTGSALSFGINLSQLPWPYVQFSYTNSSGSGTLTVSIFGKDLN